MKSKLRKGLVLGIIVLFVGASVVSSMNILTEQNKSIIGRSILYVGGSGPGNYSTIQDAINAASDGDTVYVYDDSSPYYEHVWVQKSINLIGENKDTTVIDGSGTTNTVRISDDDAEVTGFTIQNSGSNYYYGGIKIESSNNIISGNILSNNYGNGIILDYSSVGNTISENIIKTNHRSGICLDESMGNTISENIINNNQQYGIELGVSSDNTITSNTIQDNIYGIYIIGSSNGNTISGNLIIDNYRDGVNVWGANSNTINGNNISDNGYNGIRMYHSSNTLVSENNICNNGWDEEGGMYLYYDSNNNDIYHNNFIANFNWNAKDECINTWDDGYPSGGNYWDDYNGTDADGDGIGDTPYPIPGGDNEDRYPLIELYGDEPQYITRKKIITIAEAYVNHEWYPAEENVFHGFCIDCNKQVDTPDRDYYGWPDWKGWKVGQKNIGVPYQWGGFSSLSGLDLFPIEEFDEQYTGTGEYSGTIHYAGDIYCVGNECSRACGVDCSGFVSRCWNLPNKESTSTLPDLSNKIKYDSLKPGDIFDKPGSHVILFKDFVNDEKTVIRTIEAGITQAKVFENDYNAEVSQDGYSVTLDDGITYQIYSYKYISNSPPETPLISGKTNGKAGLEYEYSFNSTDPDYDSVMYLIDWGDNTTEWTEYCDSGDEITLKHTWDEEGDYTIKAKAKDIYDAESDWGYLEVTMPKSKPFLFNFPLLSWLIERFPLIQRLLSF